MERGTFAEIDHTADIGLDLEGKTPEAILEAAQRGLMCLLLADVSDLVADEERRITIEAPDLPDLLKAWCEALYRLLEEEGFVALESDVRTADPAASRAIVRGTVPSRERIASASELKAVTYHQLTFERDGDGNWRARVIFDV
ncbi:MAG: archease [Gemmatimonadota bacterium]